MERVIKCRVCGKPVIAYGSRTMFCDDCAPAARQAKKKEYKKREREKKREMLEPRMDGVHFCDSQERIELCLSCTKKKCVGDCEALRSLKVKR